MKEILIGILSGIVSGLGMGGGTILITFLVCFFNVNQLVAQASNIIFFIPTSIMATIVNIKNKMIKWNVVILLTIAGIIGAMIGSTMANKINVDILRKAFAVFILFIAIYQSICWYRKYIKKLGGKFYEIC